MEEQGNSIRYREVSTRRIRPTLPDIDVPLLIELHDNWQSSYAEDGVVVVHYDGVVHYTLCDKRSHHIFYAALALNKLSLRVHIVQQRAGRVGRSPTTTAYV
ncbi:conserved hypothetical protein [Trichinella spiralis]|uniref:hypothetical protein n=1 Tax=Trichinella spiralis TaxID=6334 RepID=UPI0001EFEB6F|nr:conserved hypothetical protein [Trichinella spiralis]